MKKISTRKLKLDRETVRQLSRANLAQVAGGGTTHCPGESNGGCSANGGCYSHLCSDFCSGDSVCICNLTETYCGHACPK
jgi:hypothetical protein